MIDIKNNKDCCGCNSCVQRCPQSCIRMQEDKEGFLYPLIDYIACVDCGICEKVCPIIHQKEEQEPLFVYAAKNKDEIIRSESSSGGVFTLLAEQVILEGGVVFGAKFNTNWEVIHAFTETMEGLAAFRGSKYVQSYIGKTYIQVETFLKTKRKVLFSGTPCQVAGLKAFLRKEYENLLTIDFICHGVPSPMVWRKYLNELLICQNMRRKVISRSSDIEYLIRNISHIEFRNKKLGWKKYSFSITFSVPVKNESPKKVFFSESLKKNVFLRGFLANLYLRPVCYSCPVRGLKSGSDLTIADFWTVNRWHPEIKNDNKGLSLLLVNNRKGDYYLQLIHDNINLWLSNYRIAKIVNPSIIKDANINEKRDVFFNRIDKYGVIDNIIYLLNKTIKQQIYSLFIKMYSRIK